MKPFVVSALIYSLALAPVTPIALGEAPPNPNPFGSIDQAPPSQPTDATDFEDDEADYGAPPSNLGFTPPGAPPAPPAFSDNAVPPPVVAPPASGATATPSLTNRAGSLPRPPARPPVMAGSANPASAGNALKTATAENGKNKPKAAPKLADYLELDNSVKGLEVKSFDLADKDIKDVVLMISKWTGKNFILDSKVRGKITIIGPSQVTVQEAYQAFLSALEANGLTTVQSGKFIRVIESAEARRAPVKTYAGDFAPKDDQFITRVFQLKYINADEVQREFRDLTTRQGKLFAYEPTNSIIITDTGSNIQRIKELLEVLDTKSFETSLHLLKIKNGSAKTISEMLSAIYGDDKKGGSSSPRSFRRNALERTRGGGIISKILPDEATNSLVVLANRAGFEQLKQLVARLDTKSGDNGRIHVYYCEYAKAEDLASTLASLSGGGSGGSRRRSSSSSSSSTTPSATASSAQSLSGSSGPVTAEIGEGVKVTADPPTNSLVITANSADFQVLKRVIRKLDIPRQQVFVETAILEISLDDSDSMGLNYVAARENQILGGFIGDSATITKIATKGIPEGITVPFSTSPRNQSVDFFGTRASIGEFTALLNLLTTKSQTSVLSTPQIIALDNEKAEFKVLDKIPVIGSSTAATATSGAVQNIEYKDVGIDIKLTPHINAASGVIRMEIEQTVDSLKESSGTVPAALGNTNIATTTRKTVTSVVVKDRDYIALGGLMSDKIDVTNKKVPLLGDIPVLGWLFKSQITKKTKTNLVILLHPTIIGTTLASANKVQDNLDKRKKFIDDNLSGTDKHKDDVEIIQQGVDNQKERSKNEPVFDYRNFMEDDLDRLERETQRQSNAAEKPAGDSKESPTSPTNSGSTEAPALLNKEDSALGLPGEESKEEGTP